MLKFDQWYLPDGEKHLSEWMLKVNRVVDGRLTYQYHKYEEALKLCSTRSVAVDAGCHVGLLAFWMARDFGFVHAFEPVAAHRECFEANLRGRANVNLHAFALGDKEGHVKIRTEPTSSGDSRVDGEGDIPMHRLDDMIATGYAQFIHVDFIKIDCEGYEHQVIAGARETLIRCRPCVIVEQKPHKLGPNFGIKGTPAVDALRELGARVVKELSGDYIMVFD